MSTTFSSFDDEIVALVRAQDVQGAATLLSTHWGHYMSEFGREVRQRILELPTDLWETNPSLLLALAAGFRSSQDNNPVAALPYLDEADSILSTDADQPPQLTVAAHLIRSVTYRGLGRISDALDQGSAAEARLSGLRLPLPVRIELTSHVLLELGICYTLAGDFAMAAPRLRQGIGLRDEAPVSGTAVEALGCLAIISFFCEGAEAPHPHLAHARAIAEGAGQLSRVTAAAMRLAECLIAIERDDLESAGLSLALHETAVRGSEYEVLWMAAQAAIVGTSAGPTEELGVLHTLQLALHEWQQPNLAQTIHDDARVSALIRLGELSAARAASLHLGGDRHHSHCSARRTARLALQAGDFDGVLDATRSCLDLGDDHAPRPLAYIDVLRAVAHDALGDTATSSTLIDRALALAAKTGWRRQFSSLPPDLLRTLLQSARQRPQPVPSAAVIEELSAALPRPSGKTIPALSTRERVILQYIVAGHTQRQIASQLQVSPNTVKSQVHSIYRKLGAVSRHEAVARASSYGLSR